MIYVVTIRHKGQITIPDKVRTGLSWLNTGSVVHVIPLNRQTLVVKPYSQDEAKKTVDWNKIEDNIALVRSFKGKTGDLASFIAKDRQSH